MRVADAERFSRREGAERNSQRVDNECFSRYVARPVVREALRAATGGRGPEARSELTIGIRNQHPSSFGEGQG